MARLSAKQKYIPRIASALLALCFVISTILTSSFAWQDNEQHTTDALEGGNIVYQVDLHKYEKNPDGDVTENTVTGAEFYLYKVGDPADTQIGGRYVTDMTGEIILGNIAPGDYYFLETHTPYGYEYDSGTEGPVTRYDFSVGGDTTNPFVDVFAYNTRLQDSLTITKTSVNADGSELTQAQLDTEFEFTVTFSDGGTYAYQIDGADSPTDLASGGTLKLKSGQTAVFAGIPDGVQYTVTETPTEQYTSQSVHHQGTITEGGVVAEFTNTYTKYTGSLTVSKTVTGDGADTEKEFSFTLTVDGSDRTFALKDGESVSFDNLRPGAAYTVTEDDYTGDGYVADPQSYAGNIIDGDIPLSFENVLDDGAGAPGSLEISKTVTGDGDLTKPFNFTVTFSGADAPDPAIQTFALTDGQQELIEGIPAGTAYTVEETPEDGYTATVSSAEGVIASNHTSQTAFVNNKDPEPPAPQYASLTVQKAVDNEVSYNEAYRRFQFTLDIGGQPPQDFELAAGESMTFTGLPIGEDYEVSEADALTDGYILSDSEYGSGTLTADPITATFTNTFVGTVMKQISGEVLWVFNGATPVLPGSVTVNLMDGDKVVDTAIVSKNEDGTWTYSFDAPKYDSDGDEIVYTVTENPVDGWKTTIDGYTITNTYLTVATAEPLVVQNNIIGDTPPTTVQFLYTMTAADGTPMPEGATGGVSTIAIDGEGEAAFGAITYTMPGVYHYTVRELDTGEPGYTYDGSVYTYTVTIAEVDNALTITSAELVKNGQDGADGQSGDKAVFTNIYSRTRSGDENVVVSGQKTWLNGNLDPKYYPNSITVLVKNGNNTVQQEQVTAADHWQWSFSLPRYDAGGNEIFYTVDEVKVPGYTKTINGFDITNTYNPNDPDGPTWQDGTKDDPPDGPPDDNGQPTGGDTGGSTGSDANGGGTSGGGTNGGGSSGGGTNSGVSGGGSGGGSNSGTGASHSSKTGDYSENWFWFGLMIASADGLAIIWLMILRNRLRKKAH